MKRSLQIHTKEDNAVIDITKKVNALLKETAGEHDVCTIFVHHTTAALTTADLDPGTDQDMLDAFYTMIPDLDYRHPHNPDHVPDHILATLIGPSVTIPTDQGGLSLGTWQRLVLFEFDGPRERHLTLHA
jgi:secondary thiamine-phosphate synthase enzyme